ncbi:MAG TPA: helix-turn-helix transcriptional regulator [Pseudonocardiaceae bacterium]|nr:helix-turn-helix transcriptional regulator [Pseudonocardiaceae bacterium]
MTKEHSTARTRDLGRRLSDIRQQAGFTGTLLASGIGASNPSLSKFEAGARSMSEVRFIQYLTLCGLRSDDIMPLVELFRLPDNGYYVAGFDGGLLDELIALIVHETSAATIEEYENAVVPGLLQSRDYARSLYADCAVATAEVIELWVDRRMDRQLILEHDTSPRLTFFIGESVLRSIVGDRGVMHDQLMKLQFACDWDNCSIRVIPAAEYGRTGGPSSFRLMSFADHGPVATQDLITAMAFVEKRHDLAVYREVLERIDRVALSLGQSRALIASLADEYGRTEAGRGRGAAREVDIVAEE